MFPPRQWYTCSRLLSTNHNIRTLADLTAHCNATWGIIPDPDWLATWVGGSNIAGTSNIVFSNGLLDPWHGGGMSLIRLRNDYLSFLGFLKSISESLVAVLIENGAHHLDLRASNPLVSLFVCFNDF